jgi:hypothetical protein
VWLQKTVNARHPRPCSRASTVLIMIFRRQLLPVFMAAIILASSLAAGRQIFSISDYGASLPPEMVRSHTPVAHPFAFLLKYVFSRDRRLRLSPERGTITSRYKALASEWLVALSHGDTCVLYLAPNSFLSIFQRYGICPLVPEWGMGG